jgi:hypothetical protein
LNRCHYSWLFHSIGYQKYSWTSPLHLIVQDLPHKVQLLIQNLSQFWWFLLDWCQFFYIPTDGKYQPIDNTHHWDTKEKKISYWMDSGHQIYFTTSHLGKDEFYDWCLLQNRGRHFFRLDLDSTELMAYLGWVHYSAQQ